MVSLLAGIAWDGHTWPFEQQHFKCAFTVQDVSVSVLLATDIFGELSNELFFAWCCVFSRMCCIGHSTSALPHSVGTAARVFVHRNISLFAVNASVARKYFLSFQPLRLRLRRLLYQRRQQQASLRKLSYEYFSSHGFWFDPGHVCEHTNPFQFRFAVIEHYGTRVDLSL